MLKMSEESRRFLEKYLPQVLEAERCNDILLPLYDLINEKGFAPRTMTTIMRSAEKRRKSMMMCITTMSDPTDGMKSTMRNRIVLFVCRKPLARQRERLYPSAAIRQPSVCWRI